MKEPVIKKINVDGLAKALTSAKGAMDNFGQALTKAKPELLKKKRGARYTKRRICKRTGRSSSH